MSIRSAGRLEAIRGHLLEARAGLENYPADTGYDDRIESALYDVQQALYALLGLGT